MRNRSLFWSTCFVVLVLGQIDLVAGDSAKDMLSKLKLKRGIVAIVGLPKKGPDPILELARQTELTLYFQTGDLEDVERVRKAASKTGLLGTRIFAETGTDDALHLGDNIADAIVVSPSADNTVTKTELLRALRPQGVAFIGSTQLVKPIPNGIDEWTHAYHGPDNNPQSNDQLVKGRFRTQFLGYPKFSPMPEQTVIAGGRI
ncbi:MAG: hypothetical protein KDA84_02875 [Planctomycetaceae bacterium]|nr:hypothetical protein [Planctomycetaceae bacterium]